MVLAFPLPFELLDLLLEVDLILALPQVRGQVHLRLDLSHAVLVLEQLRVRLRSKGNLRNQLLLLLHLVLAFQGVHAATLLLLLPELLVTLHVFVLPQRVQSVRPLLRLLVRFLLQI